jgi:hypothetical protein
MSQPLLSVRAGLRTLRRGDGSVQFGQSPGAALAVRHLPPALLEELEAAPGGIAPDALIRRSVSRGIPEPVCRASLAVLRAADVLDERPAAVAPDLPQQLAPDVLAAALQCRGLSAAQERYRTRFRRTVEVRGAGRLGAPLVVLLRAAGVGTVRVRDAGPVRPADLAPGGLTSPDLGRTRQRATLRAADRSSPPPADDPGTPADLVVFAPPAGTLPPPVTGLELVVAGTPHLFLGVRELRGVVGPLVAGSAACWSCLHLSRCDRDPAWPRLADQLTRSAGSAVEACDVVLAAAVCAAAAAQVLAVLDGDPGAVRSEEVATLGGTLELVQPGWRWARRSWPRHAACPCGDVR